MPRARRQQSNAPPNSWPDQAAAACRRARHSPRTGDATRRAMRTSCTVRPRSSRRPAALRRAWSSSRWGHSSVGF